DLPDMRRNASVIQEMMRKRGVASRLLEVDGAPPAIFGELNTPGATNTVMFYVHYDGQPVEPLQWTGSEPFRPVLRDAAHNRGGKIIAVTDRLNPESYLYARSASDDKAPILALMTALDAMKASGIRARSNIKFFFDGEEEAGSPHLPAILAKYKHLLGANVWIFCDGPVHQSRKQQVVFGVRGTTGLNLTVYGPNRELHSGHYGNWAPNPVVMISHLVASMRNEEGKILIDGFYDDVEPLSDDDKRAIAATSDWRN
ncbi:MAG: M20/M25/M40 family metallo-hydrolase, partial [Candidatus Solibacter usitatus]|nr:M20/M25/M40 family metallo-hydrolase [Candidatus Solibacter usitatus]